MGKEKRKISVVTGSRAEYGLLRLIIREIADDPDLTLQLIVTGTHLSSAFGSTVNEIIADGYQDFAEVPLDLRGDDHRSMSVALGQGVAAYTHTLAELRPDMMVVLGDRFEIFAAVIAAYTLQIPVVHLHGGEVTRGALDDGYRHSMTKLSSLHFVAAEPYRRRVIQMGEQPSSVFCVGAPGVEGVHRISRLSLAQLSERIGLPLSAQKYIVVAYHPETATNSDLDRECSAIMQALMKVIPDYDLLLSQSNADAGGRRISAIFDEFVKGYPNHARTFSSLGHVAFVSLLSHSKMLVGNSSSGIIEAPAIRIPTVNIGRRQEGRLFGPSILTCAADATSIIEAIRQAETLPAEVFEEPVYGTGLGLARTVVNTLKSVDISRLLPKKFFDFQEGSYDIG
jgi:GDP/UDP-N,N'-diacetylbacillosamine 2-epimerase (hydrolysing)